jgi:hypothetical protein
LLLLCPNESHHIWIGSQFRFEDAGIEVDDEGLPIMSRLLKWMAKVAVGEVFDKSLVGSTILTADFSLHL